MNMIPPKSPRGNPASPDWPVINWQPIHGLVQVAIVVYDKDRGWLTAKRGIIYGGRHGDEPLIEGRWDHLLEIVKRETLFGLHAIRARWLKP